MTAVLSIEQLLISRDEVLQHLKMYLLRAQQRMKQQADGHLRDIQLEVGDLEYLKLLPYRQTYVARRSSAKLAPIYYRPFAVEARVG